jgi:Transposase IS66 family
MSINSDTSPAKANTPESEVEGLRRLVEEQRKLIEKLFKQLENQKERIEQLEAELRAKKKLKGKPRLSASLLNQPEPKEPKSDKRAGSAKESKKANFESDEEISIQPASIPANAKFNGYRNYDVQELIIKRHNIRFQLAEYITEDVLNEEAKAYLENYQLPHKHLLEIGFSEEPLAITKEDWHNYLLGKGIVSVKTVRVLSEAALLGGLTIQGRSEPLRILSDGAGQFNVMEHGLCWVHIERGLRKLAEFVRAGFPLMERTQAEGKNEQERENIADMQGLLWEYYQELKQYQQQPSSESALSLQGKFDEIFGRCYIRHGLLNHVLNQIRNRKLELLQVLNCPEFPLHNNAAETDIREYVTRRKISGGTRSELGRKARDTFVGLKKTCRKLGISFWNYLTSRLYDDEQVLPLSDVLRAKAAAKIPAPA